MNFAVIEFASIDGDQPHAIRAVYIINIERGPSRLAGESCVVQTVDGFRFHVKGSYAYNLSLWRSALADYIRDDFAPVGPS